MPEELLGRKEARRMDRFTQFAVVAARKRSKTPTCPRTTTFKQRVGARHRHGHRRHHHVLAQLRESQRQRHLVEGDAVLHSDADGQRRRRRTSRCSTAFSGPIFSAASACASANDAIVTAYNLHRVRRRHAMITGGSEATVSPLAIGGFCSMRAMSTRNDDPARASRPFDTRARRLRARRRRRRAGARGIRARQGARREIYCEMLGLRAIGGRYDLVAPDPDGSGVQLALQRARSQRPASRRATSTTSTRTARRRRIGDPAESKAIEAASANTPAIGVSSTKSMHGHALGAAGGIEGVATVLAVHERHHAADDQLRVSGSRVHARLRAERRAQSADSRGALELVRIRRTQQRHRLRQSPRALTR